MVALNDYIVQEVFCINLKWYRFNRGLTQEQLAELSNCTPKYISDLERGKFSPSMNKLQDIAKAFNIHPYELLKPDHMDDPVEFKRVDEKR
ncbi:MAG: helix-turn-helix transcriptional regulator [Bacilli bacterium]|nr:helix-turn-helix transcriptional regulator [Bacilli bacterium]